LLQRDRASGSKPRSALGLPRQIFFVSIGGCDTRSGQLPAPDSLF
jgi:uncharacterized protein (DUF1501 family)